MPLVAGVDSSTQSCTVELRDLDSGALVASARTSHPATTPPASEQDPAAWWDALRDALGQIREHLPRVVAISVAAQQHGLVVLDARDHVIRRAKLWNDTTSAPQAEALVAHFGAEWWAEACGSVPVASFTVTKLLWLAEHEPDGFARIRRVLLPHDHLTWGLTGEHVTDRGDASGTGWWADGGYIPAVLGHVGLEAAWLPAVLGPTESPGQIHGSAAEDLGLPSDVLVGPGTGDNMGAALGLGLRTGDVVVSLGTSGTVYARSTTRTTDATGSVAGFADAAGCYLPLVCTLNATKVTDTMAGWLGIHRDGLAALALDAPPGSGGVVVVPYLDGERTPNRPDATGRIGGLRTATTRAQLARAAHEGVVCGLLDGIDALGAAGVATGERVFLVGGGARSIAYREVAADLLGAAVLVPETDETVATGACVQAAAVVTGDGLSAVASSWPLGEGTVAEPRPGVDAAAIRESYRRAAHVSSFEI